MTKEQIIQNIKARISTIESYRPDEYALNQGNLFELKDLLLMIEKDEPSLPSNLDEAANKANFEKPHSLNAYIAFEEAFKAGAEWMARQGVILNLSIDELSCGAYNACVEQGLTSEDDVIIQIRKK